MTDREKAEAAFVRLLEIARRDEKETLRLMLDEIAHKWAAMRYPKSRRKRIAEVWLRHRYGSLAI
jgi:hypothetical protein